jgi:16S rRNA (guanine1207-N2)-methyltransferase
VVAGRLKPGAHLWLFGANDEGIRSAQKLGAPFFEGGVTVSARKHARVLCLTRLADKHPPNTLGSYKQTAHLDLKSAQYEWHHFPGTFAKGRLDQGSRLLLECFKPQVKPETVLDFGCGTGVLIGLSGLNDCPHVHMLDRDFVALEAARLNLPQAQLHWSNRWLTDHSLTFDLIISNPPIHDGKIEDHSMVEKLIEDAQKSLTKNGELWMVVQHRVPVEKMLHGYFRHFETRGKNSVFKVWRAIQEG